MSSGTHGQRLLRFNMRSLRRLAVGRLSHWILSSVVCQLYDHSDLFFCALGFVICSLNTTLQGALSRPCMLFRLLPRTVISTFDEDV